MKRLPLILFCCFSAVRLVSAGALPANEARQIKAEVAEIMALFEKGDAQALLDRTHESAYVLTGGDKDAFERIAKQAAGQLLQTGIKFLGSELGEPTGVYAAGKYEICFVPRISIFEFQGRKMKSTGFMIAARTVGQRTWKYLDGAGLRRNPGLLKQLFPGLEQNVPLPPNLKELL